MDDQQEKLLIKIKKLMAKAADPSVTEAEAANFAAGARQMLIDHKLSEASLDDVSLERNPLGRQSVQVAGRWQVAKWKIDLFFDVAKYNFCRAVHSKQADGHFMHLLGKETDREIVLYLYDQLVAKIEALSKSEVQKAIRRGEVAWHWRGRRHPSQWQFSFSGGAADTIGDRLRTEYMKQKQGVATNTTTALIVLSDKELDSYKQQQFPYRLGTFRLDGAMHGESAYRQGQKAGYGVAISRGVGSGSETRKIGSGE